MPETPAPSSFESILSTARLPEHTVRIPLRGDLVAQHEALEAQLKAMGDFTQSHLAAADPRTVIAEEIVDLEQQITASEHAFTFRALSRVKYRELRDLHPGRDTNERFNPYLFPRALIAACCIDPVMSEGDVDRLFDVLNEASVELLFMGAWTINEGVTRVPFSKAASDLIRRSETK